MLNFTGVIKRNMLAIKKKSQLFLRPVSVSRVFKAILIMAHRTPQAHLSAKTLCWAWQNSALTLRIAINVQRIFQRKTLASWGLGIDVRRRRERGGASLLSHLGGGGGGGSGGGGDDSPPASARDTRPGPAAAARVHESVLLLLLRPPLRLLLPPLPPLPPLPCGVA